ncbi:MAG: hypothetical protein E6J41_25405 [Chloroflexi bacterium]|nr:MAG: hypothetical protein E6J41_25405 [Chloroflexota bacterium]
MASHRVRPRTLVDLAVNALDARLDPDYRWRGGNPMTRLRPPAVALIGALPLFLLGVAAWYVVDEPLPRAPQVLDPVWRLVDVVMSLSAVVVLVALSATAGAALVALVRRRRGFVAAGYTLLGALGVCGPAGFLVITRSMYRGADHEYTILAVVGPALAVTTILVAALRLRLDRRVALAATVPVAVFALVLLAATVTLGAYGADLLVHGVPNPAPGAPTAPLPGPAEGWLVGWLLALAAMGAACVATGYAIVRGLGAGRVAAAGR